MSAADLPLQRGASDLAAALQLRGHRPADQWSVDEVTTLTADLAAAVRATPAQVDQLRAAAGELAATGGISKPAAPAVIALVDELLGRQVDEAVEVLQHQAAAAIDPCSCPPGLICAEDQCQHCRDLDPSLPCPHDTMPAVDGITVDVGEPVLSPAQLMAGTVDVVHAVAADQLAAAGLDVVVDWPAVRQQPLQAVAAASARPSTGHLPTLDWRGNHDVRSLSYGVREHLTAGQPLQLADVLLPIGPVLDQGGEGECVGMGVVDAANVLDELAGNLDGQLLGEDSARRLYRRAQQLDDRPGESYSGTSVLAGMKAGVESGLWQRYLWSFGTRDIAATLMRRRPVVIGIPWLSGMYETAAGGRVDVTGEDTGAGHCLVIVGLRLTGPQGQPGPWFTWLNSWGTSYGDSGLGYVHHRDLARLLRSHGEAAVPLPAGAS